jgi:hypothetical protein
MQKALALLAVLLIAGCGAQAVRPDFLTRSVQDCANGDMQACDMLGSLGTKAPATAADATKSEARPPTQQQLDADAIMAGMRRAKSSPPAQNIRVAPAIDGDS